MLEVDVHIIHKQSNIFLQDGSGRKQKENRKIRQDRFKDGLLS